MKKIIFLLMIVFIFAGTLGISALAEEEKVIQLFENPGFEEVKENGEFDDWNTASTTFYGTNVAVANGGHTGEKSLKMYGESTALVTQVFKNAYGGATYTFEGYLRMTPIENPSAYLSGASIDVYFRDEMNTVLDYEGQSRLRLRFTEATGNEWQKITFDVVAPENTANITVHLRHAGGGELYWDDVTLSGVLAPQNCVFMEPLPGEQNLLENGTFETPQADGTGVKDWASYDKKWETYVSVVNDAERGRVVREYSNKEGQNPWVYYRVENLKPNYTYQVSGYLKTVDVNINYLRTFGPSFSIALHGENMEGASSGKAHYQSPTFNHTYEQWQKVAFQFTVPEGADYAYVYPRLYNKGEIYWDDIEMYVVKEPPVAEIYANHMYYTDLDAGIIELDFLDDNYAGCSYDIFITDGSEILLDESLEADDYIEYEFDVDLLAVEGKEYTLDVYLKDAGGRVVEHLNKDIYRYDRPTNMTKEGRVKDGNGNIFYPVIGYHCYYEDLGEAASYGINVMRSYGSEDGTIKPAVGRITDMIKWLDEAWYEHGIMTMACLYATSSAGHASMLPGVREMVNAIKDHPGLLGYLVQDEPYNSLETDKITEELKTAYKEIRALDKDHIIAHVANRPQHWDKSIDLSDMIISDRYPASNGEYFRNLQYNYISNAKAFSRGEKPVWNLIQASAFDDYDANGLNLRNMIYQTMFASGDGLGYIAVSAADSSGSGLLGNESELKVLAELEKGELADAIKAFVTGEYTTFCELSGAPLLDNYMDFLHRLVPESYWYKAYIKNNQLYLLVLNHENEAVDVSIPLVSTDKSIAIGNFTATVVDGVSSANNVSGNGTLETTIPAREAVLYKISPDTIPDYSKLTGVRGMFKDGETVTSLVNGSYNLQGAKFAALYDISGEFPQLVKVYPAKDFNINEIEPGGKYMVKLFSWKGTLFENLTPEYETIVIE